jgi:hypothetical protein
MATPRSAHIWSPDEDDVLIPLGVGATQVYCDDEPTYTGVFDEDGTEIVRMPRPIGFRFGDTDND